MVDDDSCRERYRTVMRMHHAANANTGPDGDAALKELSHVFSGTMLHLVPHNLDQNRATSICNGESEESPIIVWFQSDRTRRSTSLFKSTSGSPRSSLSLESTW